MFELYVNYFKWLCQLHPSLLYSETQKVFELSSVEEAYADYRGKVSNTGFFFRLVDYSWGVGGIGAFEFQRKQGAFIVGKKIDVRAAAAAERITARNQCETLVTDFITHMLADSRNGHPLFSNNSDELANFNFNASPVFNTGDGTYDGLICTFDFAPAKDFTLACHPVAEWQTLSPTSYGGGWELNNSIAGNWILNDGGEWLLNSDT